MADTDVVAPRASVPGASTRDGLAALSPELLALRSALDRTYASWGLSAGAVETAYPALMRVGDLAEVDYFVNFPHLAVVAAPLDPASHDRAHRAEALDSLPAGWLSEAQLVLPSAACFQVYNHLRGSALDRPARVTTVATCARNETHYDGLRRLLCFTMRELVIVGTGDDVVEHVSALRERIAAFVRALELPVEFRVATDPFFDPSASRAVAQRLFPVKQEVVFGDDLAIASLNVHRNFFGERCEIRLADGSAAFSGCVAFGLERWLAALYEHFGEDPAVLVGRVSAAAAATGAEVGPA